MACRDGLFRPSNFVLWRWAELVVERRTWKSGKQLTFSWISLDPDNRLRYPPVSLFFVMCLWSGLARLVQENLFDDRFAWSKVGCWVQNLHGWENLKCRKFGPTCPILRATPIFPALPGAARWRSLPPMAGKKNQRDVSFSLFEVKVRGGNP